MNDAFQIFRCHDALTIPPLTGLSLAKQGTRVLGCRGRIVVLFDRRALKNRRFFQPQNFRVQLARECFAVRAAFAQLGEAD